MNGVPGSLVDRRKIEILKWISPIKYIYLSRVYTGNTDRRKVNRIIKVPSRYNNILHRQEVGKNPDIL